MQSQMTNILTHVVCKDEDNVRLFAGAEDGVGVDGAEEEEELESGHLSQLPGHSVITDQRIALTIFCQLSLCFTSWAHILEIGLRGCYLIFQNIVQDRRNCIIVERISVSVIWRFASSGIVGDWNSQMINGLSNSRMVDW